MNWPVNNGTACSLSRDLQQLRPTFIQLWPQILQLSAISQKQQQQQPFYDPLSGTTRVSRCQKKHSPTHTYPDHQPSFASLLHYYDPWHPPCSIYVPDSLFCTTSLQILFSLPLGLEPPLHAPYISSPNHCLLFATNAHTIATCLAVVPRLWHLFLVSLSTLYLELCL